MPVYFWIRFFIAMMYMWAGQIVIDSQGHGWTWLWALIPATIGGLAISHLVDRVRSE